MSINGKKVAKVAATGARGVGDVILLILRIIATGLLILLTTGIIFACIFAFYVKNDLASDLDVDLSEFTLNQTSTIYALDKSTGEYQVLTTLYTKENRIWVEYTDMPEFAEHAAVAIEDKRFYKHQGVDWYRTAAAAATMFLTMDNNFGGSTITQQLIKNLTKFDEATVKRKLLEIFRALDFEKHYSKPEIIEWYLNTVNFGGRVFGIGSAANYYFGKSASELTLAECASIIGITNNPSVYNPYISDDTRASNKKRQVLILDEMLDQGYISQAQHDEAVAQELVFKRGSASTSADFEPYSWFVEAVIDDVTKDLMIAKNVSEETADTLLFTAGYKIYTTMDPSIQAMVDEIYENRDNIPSGYAQSETQELNSSIVIIDPHTGDIVALAGSMGEKTSSLGFSYATDMLRPPGSTIKPIASYGPAIELGYVMPYTTFNDGKDVKLQGTSWYPNNDTYSYTGLVTLRYALQRSINTVAAQLVDMLTPQVSYAFLRDKLGVTSMVPDDASYAPMALGQLTYGISPRELAAAYTAYANEGIYNSSRTYSRIVDSQGNVVYENQPTSIVACSDTTAYYMTDMLCNVVNSGTGYRAGLSNMPVAGKTGASSNWCDRWFVGYTPYYVAAVWTGYPNPEYMGSSNPSTTLWKLVMEKVHAGMEYTEFPVPDDMVWTTVCVDSGLLATEACKKDIRGDHSMKLRMEKDAVPRSYCDCHVMTEVCGISYGLPAEDCPEDDLVEVGLISLEGLDYKVLTPEFLNEDDKPVTYILEDMKPCPDHNIDPATGWFIDSETGYLISPYNGMLYDMVNRKVYDQHSGWEVDVKTGMLIHPDTGKLIDPYTAQEYVPEGPIDPNKPNAIYTPEGFLKDEPKPPKPTDTIPQPEDDPDYTPPPATPEPSDDPISGTPTPTPTPAPSTGGSNPPPSTPSGSPPAR